jgi:anti-sigma factor RsiW
MTCREAIDFLMAYLDGELTAEQRAAFDHHLSVCAACRRYLASYQETVRLERIANPQDAPPVPDDLVRAIVAARDKSGPAPRPGSGSASDCT